MCSASESITPAACVFLICDIGNLLFIRILFLISICPANITFYLRIFCIMPAGNYSASYNDIFTTIFAHAMYVSVPVWTGRGEVRGRGYVTCGQMEGVAKQVYSADVLYGRPQEVVQCRNETRH